MSSVNLRVTTTFERDRDRNTLRLPKLPAEVRDHLSPAAGDRLVWEQGTAMAAERAALRHGSYFVVYVERAARAGAVVESEAASGAGVPLPTIQEAVERRIQERNGRK